MDEAFGRISEFAELSMWMHGTPGMVLGVTDRAKTLFSSARGLSDVCSRRPLETDALFQIGSVSKSFTSIALLQHAERGALALDDPVKRHLPWFSVKSKYSEITLHHLMTHTGGIILGTDATPAGWTEVWDLRDTETSCEPGTYFHYSNSGYKALGLVLETVSGRSYGEIILEDVLGPAGMRSTEPIITNGIRGRLATGHMPTHDDRPTHGSTCLSSATWFESDTGDGTICAPLEDMLAYIRVLLNRGQGPWGQIFSPDSFRRMTTPHIHPEDGLHGEGYGYGVIIEAVDGHTRISHTGGMVGYYTAMVMDMDSGIGAMAMVNGPGLPEGVTKFAMDTLNAAIGGGSLPDVPKKEDAFKVPNASDYVGTYSGPSGTLEVAQVNGTLHLTSGGRKSVLQPKEGDAFFSDAPGLELFLIEFERDGEKVARAYHGPGTYARDGTPPQTSSPPEEGGARIEGHYRCHNPWLSNMRVVRRAGGFAFVLPEGPSRPMVPIGENAFRIGSDPRSPERIVFDCIIDGVATAATVSGGGRLGRTFTP